MSVSDPAAVCPSLLDDHQVEVIAQLTAVVDHLGLSTIRSRTPATGYRGDHRAKGLTVRSSVDRLIAAVAVRTGSPVLATARDSDAFAQVSDLVLEPAGDRRSPG